MQDDDCFLICSKMNTSSSTSPQKIRTTKCQYHPSKNKATNFNISNDVQNRYTVAVLRGGQREAYAPQTIRVGGHHAMLI